jgi:3',5'-cyclic-AMP phosphodiesterase
MRNPLEDWKGETDMKILHVSDLHYKKSSRQERLLDLARQKFERLQPDLILITGDLTNEGKWKQFKAVEEFLENLKDFCDVRIIPGNRDVKEQERQEKYQKHISSEMDFFYRDSAQGIAIVGLNSTPKITKHQRKEMKRHFNEGMQDEVRIFCAHHSFVPVPTKKVKAKHFDPHAGDILEELVDLHVDLLCCGHIHHSHVWPLSGLVCCSAGLLFEPPGEKDGFFEIEIGRELRIVKRSLFLAKPEIQYNDPNFRRTRKRWREEA